MIDDDLMRLALRNRMLQASGLPSSANQAFSNEDFTPTTGVPYIEEDFVPAGSQLLGFPANGAAIEVRGLYVIRWYGVIKQGEEAIRAGAKGILAKLSAGTVLPLSNGDAVRISGRPAPWAGQVRPAANGFAVCPITIPYWLITQNAVIA